MNAKSKRLERSSRGPLFLSSSYGMVKSRYLGSSVGSCHDFCKFGQRKECEDDEESLTLRKFKSNRVISFHEQDQGKDSSSSFHVQNQGKDSNSSDRKKKLGINMKASSGIPKKPGDNIKTSSSKYERVKISPRVMSRYDAKGIGLFDMEFEAPKTMQQSKEPSKEVILFRSPEQKTKSEVEVDYTAEALLDKNVFYESVEMKSPLPANDPVKLCRGEILPESPRFAVSRMKKESPTVKREVLKLKKSSTSAELSSVSDKKMRSWIKMNVYNKAKVQNMQQEANETGISENVVDIIDVASSANDRVKSSPQLIESVPENVRTPLEENIQSQFEVDNKLNHPSSLNSTKIELEDVSHSSNVVKLSSEEIISESQDIAADCMNDLKLRSTMKERGLKLKALIVPEPSTSNTDILRQKKAAYAEMKSIGGQIAVKKKSEASSKHAKAFPLKVRVPLVSSMSHSRTGNCEGKVVKSFKVPEPRESLLPEFQKASIYEVSQQSSENTALECNQKNSDKEDEVGEVGEVSEYQETQMKQNHRAKNQEDKRRARRTPATRLDDDSSSPHKLKFKRGRVIELRETENFSPRRLRFKKNLKAREPGERQLLKLRKASISFANDNNEIHENTILDHNQGNFNKEDEVSELSGNKETEIIQNHGALNQEENRRARRTPAIEHDGDASLSSKLKFNRGRVIELRETKNVGPRRRRFTKSFQIHVPGEKQLLKLQKASISCTKDDGEIHENTILDHYQENFNEDVGELSGNDGTKRKQDDGASDQEDISRARRNPAIKHDGDSSSPFKLKFKRGRVIELRETENVGPRRLRFRRGRVLGGNADGSQMIMKKSFRMTREMVEPEETDSEAKTVALKHQETEEKKDLKSLFNHVIEETASKLVEARKSKVKALVGAFETVISLQETNPTSLV